jgi:hypothetical protein
LAFVSALPRLPKREGANCGRNMIEEENRPACRAFVHNLKLAAMIECPKRSPFATT